MLRTESNAVSPHSDTSQAGDQSKFFDSSRAQSLLGGFAALYEGKEFTDVILTAGGVEFPCHRNVLAISSPYFMGMFNSPLVENQKGRVRLKEMDAQTLSLVLDYIYTGEVLLTEELVQNLLSAANLFQLISLRTGCADFMIKHVTISNCIGIYFFARAHECDSLAQKAKQIINKQFGVLCLEQEFLALPCDKLVELIQDDDLSVINEQTVYEACLAWVNYNLEERRSHLFKVMRHVRFVNISCYYFCDAIESNSLLCSDPYMAEIRDKVKYYHMLKNRVEEIDLNFLPRRGMVTIRGVIVMANPHCDAAARKFNSMELLLPKTGEMEHLCKLPQGVYMPGACITGDNQIFLAGGAIRKINYRGPILSDGISANLFLYDHHFGSWQVKAKMHHGRSQFPLVMVDGELFAIGGQSDNELLATVEKYDVSSNIWSQVSPLPKPLRCMVALGFKGMLYVFGGETTNEITNCAFRYDPKENKWEEIAPMTTPRALAGGVVYKNKIYVIGGNSQVSAKWKKELLPEHCVASSEIYDPATNIWSKGPELPNALCGAGVVKYGESVIVVGGEDDRSWMAGTYVLRTAEDGTDTWGEGHELPSVMSTFSAVVANIPRDLVRGHDG